MKMLITPEGLVVLERIVRSCPPTVFNGGMPCKEYLYELAAAKRPVVFEEFKRDFPKHDSPLVSDYNVYDHLADFVRRSGSETIDDRQVISFFSGHPHIERAGLDIMEERFEEILTRPYAMAALFSHVLLPVVLDEVGSDLISGTYRNQGLSIKLSHLVALPEVDDRLKSGARVWVHYASIVLAELPNSFDQDAKVNQAGSLPFMQAFREIAPAGIDHRRMLHYPWAAKLRRINF